MRLPLFLSLALALTPTLSAQEPDWERGTHIPPLFSVERAEDASQGSVLWPFIHWRRVGSERSWGFRPIIDWERDSVRDRTAFDILYPLVFPLIRYDRSRQELDWHALPVYGGWRINRQMMDRDRHFGIFPLVHTQSDPHHRTIYAFPYLRMREGNGGEQVQVDALLPILYRSIDQPDQEVTRAIFPVIWREMGGSLGEVIVFPLYWHRWNNQPERFHLFPLYGQSIDRDESGSAVSSFRYFLGPLYVEQREAEGDRWIRSVLWPLFARGGGENHSLTRALPLFSYQEDSLSGGDFTRQDMWAGLVWISRHLDGEELFSRRITGPLIWWWYGPDLAERRYDSWGLYPLVNGDRVEGVNRHFSVFDPLSFLRYSDATRDAHARWAPLWRLFDREESLETGRVEVQSLWRLYHRVTEGDSTEVSVFPFLSHERRPDRRRTSFLWRVFQLTRDRDGARMRLLFSPEFQVSGAPDPA